MQYTNALRIIAKVTVAGGGTGLATYQSKQLLESR
jgi:hypothetical protein